MTELFGIDLAGAIGDAFDGQLLTGTLTKPGVITGRDGNGDAIYSAPQTFVVQGFFDTYSAIMIAAAGIPNDAVRIILITDLCGALPAIQDKITMGGGVFQIKNIAKDPANATFDMQCFRVPS